MSDEEPLKIDERVPAIASGKIVDALEGRTTPLTVEWQGHTLTFEPDASRRDIIVALSEAKETNKPTEFSIEDLRSLTFLMHQFPPQAKMVAEVKELGPLSFDPAPLVNWIDSMAEQCDTLHIRYGGEIFSKTFAAILKDDTLENRQHTLAPLAPMIENAGRLLDLQEASRRADSTAPKLSDQDVTCMLAIKQFGQAVKDAKDKNDFGYVRDKTQQYILEAAKSSAHQQETPDSTVNASSTDEVVAAVRKRLQEGGASIKDDGGWSRIF